jgi:multiple sugar transport system permease protein
MTTVTPRASGVAAEIEAPAFEDQGRVSDAQKSSPWWLYAVLGVGLLAMSLPFLWMLVSSVKPEAEVRQIPPTWLPETFTLENYQTLFDRLSFPTYFFNSTLVAIFVTLGNVVFCSMLGYALA